MFVTPKSVASVCAWGWRPEECWTVWDVPVNKGFCVPPVFSVRNLSVLGRKSPLEGSSPLSPFSPFPPPRVELVARLSQVLSQTSQRDAPVTSAWCNTGIALPSEKVGKSWCSAASSEQLGLTLFQKDCCCCRKPFLCDWIGSKARFSNPCLYARADSAASKDASLKQGWLPG